MLAHDVPPEAGQDRLDAAIVDAGSAGMVPCRPSARPHLCGYVGILGGRHVAEDGTVTPSLACPACDFQECITFEG
jgi:hypothetical protein